MIKKNCFLLEILSWKPSFSKNLTDWHESSRCCCYTITRSHLRSFSVIGDVSLTLFALKSPPKLWYPWYPLRKEITPEPDTLNLCYFECMFMWYENMRLLSLTNIGTILISRGWIGVSKSSEKSSRSLTISLSLFIERQVFEWISCADSILLKFAVIVNISVTVMLVFLNGYCLILTAIVIQTCA